MIERYNLGRKFGEYSVNTISYDYKTQTSREYASKIESEDSQVIKLGGGN